MLNNKKIILAVSGSIAAYKSAHLTRLMVKAGAEVKVVMTDAAKDFIGPLTLSTLSKNEVFSEYFDSDSGSWNNHVKLGIWADLIVVAPATANTIAKMANGICDNLLQAVYLSARCPVMIAPAMDLDMYLHPSFTRNIDHLKSDGVHIIDAESGELASGLKGQGRMAEPEHLLEHIESFFAQSNTLGGKKFLVNAGPTYEAIDPVRFIGNRSSGKMGVAIANELAKRGASVTLVLGPSKSFEFHPAIDIQRVESAGQMHDACVEKYPEVDAAILTAAVADYKPMEVASEKIKKKGAELELRLQKTVDILSNLGQNKKDQFLVGFALETENELENAKEKLEKKKLDMIVLNSLKDKGAGFSVDTNKISIIKKGGNIVRYDLKLKTEVARDIVDQIETEIC